MIEYDGINSEQADDYVERYAGNNFVRELATEIFFDVFKCVFSDPERRENAANRGNQNGDYHPKWHHYWHHAVGYENHLQAKEIEDKIGINAANVAFKKEVYSCINTYREASVNDGVSTDVERDCLHDLQ